MSNAKKRGRGLGTRMAAHTVGINHLSSSLSLCPISLFLSLSPSVGQGRAARFKLYKSFSSIHGICWNCAPSLVLSVDLGDHIVVLPDAVDLFHNKSIFVSVEMTRYDSCIVCPGPPKLSGIVGKLRDKSCSYSATLAVLRTGAALAQPLGRVHLWQARNYPLCAASGEVFATWVKFVWQVGKGIELVACGLWHEASGTWRALGVGSSKKHKSQVNLIKLSWTRVWPNATILRNNWEQFKYLQSAC